MISIISLWQCHSDHDSVGPSVTLIMMDCHWWHCSVAQNSVTVDSELVAVARSVSPHAIYVHEKSISCSYLFHHDDVYFHTHTCVRVPETTKHKETTALTLCYWHWRNFLNRRRSTEDGWIGLNPPPGVHGSSPSYACGRLTV